nr:T9SS type A sorting domain-containing protein [Nitrosopumilus sp.]
LLGQSRSEVSGNKSSANCNNLQTTLQSDNWLVLIDSAFNILWDQTFGGELNEAEVLSNFKTQNNEVVFTTSSISDISCEKSENNRSYPLSNNSDYWIVKIDSNGNKIWDKTYGSVGEDINSYIVELTDGNYLVSGNGGDLGTSGDKTVNNWGGLDFWVVKMDSSGNKIWDNVYGGYGNDYSYYNANKIGHWIISCENGSFLLGGTSDSGIGGDISDPGYGMLDLWIIKVDSSGNKLWDKKYGGTNHEWFNAIFKTSNGFILAATTKSPPSGTISQAQIGDSDIWIAKLDTLGNIEWEKRYGGTMWEEPVSIKESGDGGYIISAITESPPGFDISEPPYGSIDYWIFKTDSVGNKIWDKRFGGPGQNWVSNFIIMSDSSIYLAGYADSGTSAVKTDPGYGGSDYWVVHFKYSDSTVSVNDFEEHLDLTLYPNPASDEVSISWYLSKPEDAVVEIYNNLGQLIHSAFKEKSYAGRNETTISTAAFPKGIYHLRFSVAGNIVTKKLVKM